jgi:hypothetical protein
MKVDAQGKPIVAQLRISLQVTEDTYVLLPD